MWQDIKILDLEITLVAIEDIRLPFFRENALRSALGTSLRSAVCIDPDRDACRGCTLEALCAYSKLFSPSRENFPAGGFSLPYLSFFAPDTPLFLSSGTPFTLHLRLLGPAVAYYPYFYFCLEDLARKGIGLRHEDGKRGRFILERIDALSPDGRKTAIFPGTPAFNPGSCGPALYSGPLHRPP